MCQGWDKSFSQPAEWQAGGRAPYDTVPFVASVGGNKGIFEQPQGFNGHKMLLDIKTQKQLADPVVRVEAACSPMCLWSVLMKRSRRFKFMKLSFDSQN